MISIMVRVILPSQFLKNGLKRQKRVGGLPSGVKKALPIPKVVIKTCRFTTFYAYKPEETSLDDEYAPEE